MMVKFILLFLTAILASLLAVPLTASASQDTDRFRGEFEVTIIQGPDAGLTLVGNLTIQVDPSGNIEGALTGTGRPQVQVTGQVSGGSIQLVLHLGDGSSISGVGPLPDGLAPGVVIAGIALGPRPGDKGNWKYCPIQKPGHEV